MGISGLLPFLEPASRKCYINEFRGCTVAIDTYCWLHKGAFSCADKLVRGEKTDAYIAYCMKYIRLLQMNNIKPILVFDGQHLPAKKDTELKRREQRKNARAKGMDALRSGNVEQARQYFRQSLDITHEMALALIKECRAKGIDCIVAPYEADAQLAYLNLQGIADVIITEDSDLVLFGCSKILFKFNLEGFGTLVEKQYLNKAMKMESDQYSFEKFRYMCILSGCDYLDSLPGIGIVRAHKAITMTHDANIYNLLPRLPRYLNLTKLTVTAEYIENFKLADATIKHQIVYDPTNRKLRPLTDPVETNIDPKYLTNAGKYTDEEKAFQMALGNIDPIRKTVLDNWTPDTNAYRSGIWSKRNDSNVPESIPNLNNSTRSVKINVYTKSLTPVQEPNMCDYDEQLETELSVYKTIEPPVKRTKSNEDVTTKVEVKAEVHSNNPFRMKKLSKFQVTTLNTNEIVTSRFFNSNSEKVPELCNLVEQMDTDDSERSKNDLTYYSDEDSFTQNALNKISTNDKENLEQVPTSPILSRTQNKTSGNLNMFKRDKARKSFRHSSFESTLIETITLSDAVHTIEVSDESSDSREVKNDLAKEQLCDTGLLSNTKFIQKKSRSSSCRLVGLSRNVKKCSQPTIISMFHNFSKK